MTRTTTWYLSSNTCTKLNTGKKLLAAFWLSSGPKAQHFWLSLHHHYKCPKLTVSGLHLWQFIQLLWLAFCKISSDVYSQMPKIRADYCVFPWQISQASFLCLFLLWWQIGTPATHQDPFCAWHCTGAERQSHCLTRLWQQTQVRAPEEAGVLWGAATSWNEALTPTQKAASHGDPLQVTHTRRDTW